MLLAVILAAPIFRAQVGQVTETKLFTLQKNKYVQGSIRLSPTLDRYAYATPDHKLVVDGKSYGPYVTTGSPLFSSDGKDWAFLASAKDNEAPIFFWNGEVKQTEFPVYNIFLAGETGPICWVERKRIKETGEDGKEKILESSRLVTPEETTDWCEKIEKISFSDDGKLFYMRTSQRIVRAKDAPPDPNIPDSEDFVVYKGGKKVSRGIIQQVFAAPNAEGFAAVTSQDSVVFKKTATKFRGQFYGKPVFSPDGKQMAFRTQFTGVENGQNVQCFQYFINGNPITTLQIQSGLTFTDDGQQWIMCGLNGKNAFLYDSNGTLTSYADAGLTGAPAEPYKVGRFVNGKKLFLFQAKRSRSQLYVEDKGLYELGDFVSAPETLSISPDGRRMMIAGSGGQETHAYFVDLQNPIAGIDVLKFPYDLQSIGKGTFVWKSDNEVTFAVLKKNDLVRISLRF